MAELKQSAEEFVSLLKRNEMMLDQVARRLDDEFATRFEGQGVDPLALAKRIKKLTADIPELKAQCQAHIQRKQALVDEARKLLVSNHGRMADLHKQCGLAEPHGSQGGDEDDAVQGFEAAMSEWDSSMKVRHHGYLEEPASYMSRDELNSALAGAILSRAPQ